MKPFSLGLVVGKFAPLHRGHEWLIEQAAAQCERLLVLSYSVPEIAGCLAPARAAWLQQRFPEHASHAIDARWLRTTCAQQGLDYRALPTNAADDATHQHYLAWLLKDVLQQYPDAFFNNEAYGEPCAAVLSQVLQHPVVSVQPDRARQQLPVSASLIRSSPDAQRQWLSPQVRASYASNLLAAKRD